jgi:hypothetical protein
MPKYLFSKYIWAGVLFVLGSIFAGIFTALGEDLYNTSKGLVQTQPISIEILIPITFGLIGVGLIAYDIFSRRRSQQRKQKDDEEDRWKYFPSNVP